MNIEQPTPNAEHPIPGFYSEHGEDRWIWEHVPWIRAHAGPEYHYLDIGAMRPDTNSNTGLLRSLGWTGLVIDGHPDCEQWWQDVPGATFVCAVLDSEVHEVTFGRNRQMSKILRLMDNVAGFQTERRKTETLSNLLWSLSNLRWSSGKRSDNNVFHFLSIDVEGAEYDVLKNFDFDHWRPLIIVAEYATLSGGGRVAEDFRLRDLLLTLGYEAVHQTPANLVYLRKGRPVAVPLTPALSPTGGEGVVAARAFLDCLLKIRLDSLL